MAITVSICEPADCFFHRIDGTLIVWECSAVRCLRCLLSAPYTNVCILLNLDLDSQRPTRCMERRRGFMSFTFAQQYT